MSNVRTLLITDDCPEDREVYREYLLNDPHQSYRILEAGSAELGLALCQKEQCDAILLDFCLPDMSGLEFLDELKQLEAPLPVIMLTGQGDETIAVQAMKRGAQEYLVKQHLQSDVLQLTVRNVIERSSLRHSLSKPQDRHHLVAAVALRIRQSLQLEQVLQTAVTEVQQLLECDRIIMYRVTGNANRTSNLPPDLPLILAKVCEAGCQSNHPDPIQQFTSFLVEQNQSNITEVTNSLKRQRQSSIIVSRHRRHPQTYLLTPIGWHLPETNAHQTWGLLIACQQSGEHQWQLDEVNLLNELSGQLGIAIQQAEQLSHIAADLEQEKQLNAIQAESTTALSHAYRTHLSTILAAASTLKHQGDRLDEAKQQHFLQMIEDKVRQMTRLMEDLLILKKFEPGKASFTPLPFNLLQFFADLVEEQRQTANDRLQPDSSLPCELSFKITGNTRGFWGDPDLLRHILVNLISNALKYSPNGGTIEVHLSGNPSQIIFSVSDTGIGIPLDDQSSLFQAFHRGSNVGAIPGTGLGLAIVKTCVALHGGEITLESQEGQGTIVTVCLPKR